MKLQTIASLLTFQASQTMVQFFQSQDKLAETGIMTGLFIMAYLIAEIIFRNGFQKKDIRTAFFFGVFIGVLSQVIIFQSNWPPVFVNLIAIVFCMFPKQIMEIVLKIIGRKANTL